MRLSSKAVLAFAGAALVGGALTHYSLNSQNDNNENIKNSDKQSTEVSDFRFCTDAFAEEYRRNNGYQNLSDDEKASKVVSFLENSTECHGMYEKAKQCAETEPDSSVFVAHCMMQNP